MIATLPAAVPVAVMLSETAASHRGNGGRCRGRLVVGSGELACG